MLVVNYQGQSEVAYVGRSKVERRPLLLVSAVYKGKDVSLILQNAETIRLTQPTGQPVSITQLRKGTEVLAYIEEAGRHFGMKVDETIQEK